MSRHRNIRSKNFSEEYDEYYQSAYGQSVEDELCISPRTAEQFMFNRAQSNDADRNLSNFCFRPTEVDTVQEVDVEDDQLPVSGPMAVQVQSTGMNALERAKLMSCVEQMQDVVGETISEAILMEAAARFNYDLEKSLNWVLQSSTASEIEEVLKSPIRNEPDFKDAVIDAAKGSVVKEVRTKPTESVQLITDSVGRFSFGYQSDAPLQPPNQDKDKVRRNSVDASSSTQAKDQKLTPLIEKRQSASVVNSPKASKNKVRSAETLIAEYDKCQKDRKPLINLVVAGHVDAGKSTLMGHLLFRLGFVSKKSMHRNETDSKKMGKASFLYAWVLDETDEERSRGVTMDIAQASMETEHRSVNLLDAPGHKDFIPNMITGAAQADVALLVVDATQGEFEAGFEAGGQTREHTLLIRSLGVSQLGVVVNKLDNVQWDRCRYEDILAKLGAFVKMAGFKDSDVHYVPCSGLTGENLVEKSKEPALRSWYDGPCLLEIIDSFKPPERPISKPFRLCVCDVFKGMGLAGISVSGRIEAGGLVVGQRVIIQPAGEPCQIKAIAIEDSSANQAFVGDNVIVILTGIDLLNVTLGSFLCEPNSPAPVTNRFEARIVLFHNTEVPLTKGFPVVMHYKSMSESGVISKIISQINKSTGELVKKKPRCLIRNTAGIVVIEIGRPICLELYKDYKDLGKFMLRSGGSTIAAGMVTKIL